MKNTSALGLVVGLILGLLGSTAEAKNPTAVFKTSLGDIQIELFQDRAPKTVKNFIDLAEGKKLWTNAEGKKVKTPLYNKTIFHRVIPDFMIQGGDPLGNGTGQPIDAFADENLDKQAGGDPLLNFSKTGMLAMANRGPNTNGSQFFITVGPAEHLNAKHTIFGKVVDDKDARAKSKSKSVNANLSSQEIADTISKVKKDGADKPLEAVTIEKLSINK